MPKITFDSAEEKRADRDDLNLAIAKEMRNAEMPDLKAVICEFMKIAGGAKGVARMLRREYRDAKPGSMIRSLILQMILQGTKAISAKEGTRDASLISDQDIDKELSAIMLNVKNAGKFAGVPDGA